MEEKKTGRLKPWVKTFLPGGNEFPSLRIFCSLARQTLGTVAWCLQLITRPRSVSTCLRLGLGPLGRAPAAQCGLIPGVCECAPPRGARRCERLRRVATLIATSAAVAAARAGGHGLRDRSPMKCAPRAGLGSTRPSFHKRGSAGCQERSGADSSPCDIKPREVQQQYARASRRLPPRVVAAGLVLHLEAQPTPLKLRVGLLH